MKPNIKIMSKKPTLTEDEIFSHMDFEDVLSRAQSIHRRQRLARNFWSITIPLAIVALAVTFYEVTSDVPVAAPESIPSVQQPTVKEEATVLQDSGAQQDPPKSVTPAKKKEKSLQSPAAATKVAADETKKEVENEAAKPSPVYVEAEPVEGFPHLYEYFGAELKYPETAVKDSIQGIITVSFVVNRDGKPEAVKILNSLGAAFDEEALRLIANMPAWKPATLEGAPVKSRISLPLTFRIERKSK